jgi:hypothetical protein
MSRATRTFKLRLSPTGLDVLIASHCRLIRETRSLLAWGTTLHVAVEHLDTCSEALLVDSLDQIRRAGLAGSEEHHLGAPHRMGEIAGAIAARYRFAYSDEPALTLGNLYIAALLQLSVATKPSLLAAFDRVHASPTSRG